MAFLWILALLIGVTVFPVMVGARVVGARNNGFWSALFAVLLLSALSVAIGKNITSPGLAFAASAGGGAVVLAGVLGTTFLRGILVGVVIVAVQYAVIFFFASGMLGIVL
jgi:hypothetical protein